MNNNRDALAVGTRVRHFRFGLGTVAEIDWDAGTAMVRFDTAGKKKLALKHARLQPVPADEDRVYGGWQETFIFEQDEGEHFPGAHWSPFYEDVDTEVILKIPEIMARGNVHRGYGDFYPAPRDIPESWARGVYTIRPSVHHGIVSPIRVDEHANMLISLFPYLSDGIQVNAVLNKVIVWESGVEAQIDVSWGDASVTFFDTHFLANRAWYEAGRKYEFILTGIAYSARPSSISEIPVPPSEQALWRKILLEKMGRDVKPEVLETLHLDGMAMLLPAVECDADDYQFRGLVKSVKEVKDILGQDGWLVRVTVMRFGDKDADLDILITQRAWEGDEPPKAGQDIEGTLWLQGRLWSCEEWEVSGTQQEGK